MKKRWVASTTGHSGCGAVLQPLVSPQSDPSLPVPSKYSLSSSLRSGFSTVNFPSLQCVDPQDASDNSKVDSSLIFRNAICATEPGSSPGCHSDRLCDNAPYFKNRPEVLSYTTSSPNPQLLDALLADPQLVAHQAIQLDSGYLSGDSKIVSERSSGKNCQRPESATKLVISSQSPLPKSPVQNHFLSDAHPYSPQHRRNSLSRQEASDSTTQGLLQANLVAQQQSKYQPMGLNSTSRSVGIAAETSQCVPPNFSSTATASLGRNPIKPGFSSSSSPLESVPNFSQKEFLNFLASQVEQAKSAKQQTNSALLEQLLHPEKLKHFFQGSSLEMFLSTLLSMLPSPTGSIGFTAAGGGDANDLAESITRTPVDFIKTEPSQMNSHNWKSAGCFHQANCSDSETFVTRQRPQPVASDVLLNQQAQTKLPSLSAYQKEWSLLNLAASEPACTNATIDILRESKQVSMNVPVTVAGVEFSHPRTFSACEHPLSAEKMITPSIVHSSENRLSCRPSGTMSVSVDNQFNAGQPKPIATQIEIPPSSTSGEVTHATQRRDIDVTNIDTLESVLTKCSGPSSSTLNSPSSSSTTSAVKPPSQSHKRPILGNNRSSDACRFSLKKRLIQRYEADGAASFDATKDSTNCVADPVFNGISSAFYSGSLIKSETAKPEIKPRIYPTKGKQENEDINEHAGSPKRHNSFGGPTAAEISSTEVLEASAKKTKRRKLKLSTSQATVQHRRQPPVRATKIAVMNNVSLSESAKPTRKSREIINGSMEKPVNIRRGGIASPAASLKAAARVAENPGATKETLMGSQTKARFFLRLADELHKDGSAQGSLCTRRRRTSSLRDNELNRPNSPATLIAHCTTASLHDFDFHTQETPETSPHADSITSLKEEEEAEEVTVTSTRRQSSRSFATPANSGRNYSFGRISTERKRRAVTPALSNSRPLLRRSKSSRVNSSFSLPLNGGQDRNLRNFAKHAKFSTGMSESIIKRPHSQRKAVLNAHPSYAEHMHDDSDIDEDDSMDTRRVVKESSDEDCPFKAENSDKQSSSRLMACKKCDRTFTQSQIQNSNSTVKDIYDSMCDEDLSLEELQKSLPPPPDLAMLAHRSLCGASLSMGPVSEPFLQLNSCTDLEKLKPSLRCRACREMIRFAPPEASSNGLGGANHVSPSNHVKANRRRGQNTRNARASDSINGSFDDVEESGKTGKGDSKAVAQIAVSVFCRFWGFRKLASDSKGILSLTDFCRTTEADATDRALWAMHRKIVPSLERKTAIYFVKQLGAVACRLMFSELSILSSAPGGLTRQCRPVAATPATISDSNGDERPTADVEEEMEANLEEARKRKRVGGVPLQQDVAAWKRPVQGVREMCDVCETTTFNSHWVCSKCGYSVCSACYFAKLQQTSSGLSTPTVLQTQGPSSEKNSTDDCDVSRNASSSVSLNGDDDEEVDRGKSMMISRAAVTTVSYNEYSVHKAWSTCSASRRAHDLSKMMLTALLPYGSLHCLWHRLHRIAGALQIPLGCECDLVRKVASKNRSLSSGVQPSSSAVSTSTPIAATSLDLLAEVALKSSESSSSDEFLRDSTTMPTSLSSSVAPQSTVPANRIVYLPEINGSNTLEVFQRHWHSNQPIMISDCLKNFNPALWNPRSLSNVSDAGVMIVDCETNLIVPRMQLRQFWEGFETPSKRTISKEGRIQHLKIREWPPAGDMAEVHVDRFADIMTHLPVPEYTTRNGQFNMASRLPSFFVHPDLGPRLHVAHDLASKPSVGTMNLRVDVNDVVNILLHTSPPAPLETNGPAASRKSDAPKGPCTANSLLPDFDIDLSTIDNFDANKTSTSKGNPGALWHIFLPSDLQTLRDYLKSTHELACGQSGGRDAICDVIHDQRIYLSSKQLERLSLDTGIRPFTILQFIGDAIFIPAGSVHQVRNLSSCINMSVDFVSAEHIPRCLELTEEFRRLPRNHPSHEDKLQVKNMIYHTVKDSLSTLLETIDFQFPPWD